MAKGFSKNNPLEKLSNATPATKISDEEPMAAIEINKEPEIEKPKKKNEKKKIGRPKSKTEETKTINIAVPISVLKKLDTVKVCYGNNLTYYINKLVEKDIEANFDKYKNIVNSLNTFK